MFRGPTSTPGVHLMPRSAILLAVSITSLLGWHLTTAAAAEEAPSPYADVLREHGIEGNAEGLRGYLRQLHPDEAQRAEAQRLIDQLGGERFADRELAMQRLIAMPLPPTEALRAIADSRDPEVRWRAAKILSVQKPQRAVLMHAVFKTIEHQKTPGLAAELLKAVSVCDQRYLRMAVQSALMATAQPQDAALLREAIGSDDAEVVIAAIGALGTALQGDAAGDLRPLTTHQSEAIQLAAARALADQGDRAALEPLVKLLQSDELETRIGAVQTLRQSTGQTHNFVAYDDAAAREKAMKQWQQWVAGEGRTAELTFPLRRVRFELGRTLITIYGQNKVIELDSAGKQVWEKTGFQHPWVATGLPNGHRLVSDYSGRKVTEFNAAGEEVWSKEGLPASPFNLQRLENGNTLIACSDSQQIVEVNPSGKQIWDVTIQGRPMDARRLENGRTLVTLQNGNRVVEIDAAGKVLWELTGVTSPITAQRLENGNTLVAEVGGGRVAEWDRAGKLIWEHKGLQNPYSAQRLISGNTLIVHGSDVREVDRQGKIIWKKEMSGLAHAMRY